MLSTYEMACLAVKALDSKLARDIRVLDIHNLTALTDSFIICTAGSTPQIKTLADEVDRLLSEAGEPPIRIEGHREGGWVLVDCGCLVVHIFLEEQRKFYNLERLWNDAPELDAAKMIQDAE